MREQGSGLQCKHEALEFTGRIGNIVAEILEIFDERFRYCPKQSLEISL